MVDRATRVTAVSASNSCTVLPQSFGYTEFSPGTVTEGPGDSDGPTAFGGAANLSNFAISENASLLPPSNVAFVAGGPVTGNSTTAVHLGDTYADNNVTGVSYRDGNFYPVSQNNLPVNFALTASADTALSSELAALPTSPGDTINTSAATMTLAVTQAQSNNQYVWDVRSSQLAGISTIKVVSVPSTGSIVVNITGTGAVSLSVANVYLDGTSGGAAPGPALADATIFNFAGPTSLALAGDWAGTLFAPSSAVTFSSGHVYGTVVGASLTGANESTYGPLDTGLCLSVGPGTPLSQGRPLFLAVGGAAVIAGGVLFLGRRRARPAASL